MKNYLVILLLAVCAGVNAQTREDFDQANRLDLSKAVQIFPNPAVDFVHVRFEQFSASNMTLTVHNIIGNQVPVEVEIIDDHEIRVRVKDLSTGYYLLALKDDDDKFKGTYKFLKR